MRVASKYGNLLARNKRLRPFAKTVPYPIKYWNPSQ